MAKKYKKKTGNCRPPTNIRKYKEMQYDPEVVTAIVTGAVTPGPSKNEDDQACINGVIRNAWNEVGVVIDSSDQDYQNINGTKNGQTFKNTYGSSFPGVDPNGVALKAITYGRRCEDMFRFDLISGTSDDNWNDDNDEDAVDSSLLHEYFFDQGKKEVKRGKKSVPKWEYYCRPDYTYEEEYFQHIFNWPTTHTTKPRKIAGLVHDHVDYYGGEGCPLTGSSDTYYEASALYPSQSLTLTKTISKIYYIDDNWDYQEITLNDDGTVSGDAVTDRIGEPIIYHGGTDDKKKLFFHYVVGGTAIATDNVIAAGDEINGIEVSNVVNYIVDIALKRTVSRQAKKRTEDKEVSESVFLAANSNHTSALYSNTKSWLKLNSADGIEIGDVIWGRGIKDGTVITGVDESRSRVYLSNVLTSKKVKVVKIKNDTVNKVNKNTLCYAVLASDASFTADTNYTVTRGGASTGITICARAGAGIINRSAIVGIYNSKNKKDVEYEPIFYASDAKCEKDTLTDEYGEYTRGIRVYGDNSRDTDLYLLNKPTNQVAYQISSMYFAATNGPIDRDNLIRWMDTYNRLNNQTGNRISVSPILKVYSEINSYAASNLSGKKVAGAIDSNCGDPIVVEYTQVYNPLNEMNDVNVKVVDMDDASDNICVDDTNPDNLLDDVNSISDVQRKFNEVVTNSISQSSFLSEDYYKKLITDKNSLFNRIKNASQLSLDSIPNNTNIDNLPPQIEGQNSSGERFIAKSYRDMPPGMDRVKFYITDLLVGTDQDMNPALDLDPKTTHNQPKIIISSIPVWSGGSNATYTIPIDLTTVTYTVTTTTNSYGGLEDITVSHAMSPTSVSVGLCPDEVHTYSWVIPEGHEVFMEHKETFDQGGYVTGTNWHVHPDIRDLDNKDWPKDLEKKNKGIKQHLTMEQPVHPRTIWAPNISYQRDYHKMFWFRPAEITELIGETIENFGNPYLDDPITTKIQKTISPGDTTIEVESTDGFLSSGYLIIPKYTKKFYTTETANAEGQFTYSGEEIIYYKSKTNTTFEECERECFGTTSDFITTVSVRVIEPGVRYKIISLGTTDWQSIGAPENAEVGTIFVATADGDGSGTVTIHGTTDGEVPDPTYVAGVEKPATLPSISSYEKGHSISQHWIFKLKED